MADKKKDNEKAQAEAAAKMSDAPPAGFTRETSVSDAPWVEAQVGNVVHGRLINRYEMNTQPVRYYYQVELVAPCHVRVGKGEEAEVTLAKPGDVVNWNENHKVAELKERVLPEIIAGAKYDIWAKYTSKTNLSGGRTMWNIDIHKKQIAPPTSPVRRLDEGEGGEPDPF